MYEFLTGWQLTLRLLLYLAGGLSAVLLCVVAIIALFLLLNAVFDRYTTYLSRRWHKRGKPPRGRIAKIIYDQDDSV